MMAQGIKLGCPEFKPRYHQKKKKKEGLHPLTHSKIRKKVHIHKIRVHMGR
jgi:hypothetical protein